MKKNNYKVIVDFDRSLSEQAAKEREERITSVLIKKSIDIAIRKKTIENKSIVLYDIIK